MEIESLVSVWEFPDRWIGGKHGRQDAFSMWGFVSGGGEDLFYFERSLTLGCKFPRGVVKV